MALPFMQKKSSNNSFFQFCAYFKTAWKGAITILIVTVPIGGASLVQELAQLGATWEELFPSSNTFLIRALLFPACTI